MRGYRERKPIREYAQDKIAYIESKLEYWYGRMAEIDPDWRPNYIPNETIRATVIRQDAMKRIPPRAIKS